MQHVCSAIAHIYAFVAGAAANWTTGVAGRARLHGLQYCTAAEVPLNPDARSSVEGGREEDEEEGGRDEEDGVALASVYGELANVVKKQGEAREEPVLVGALERIKRQRRLA